MGLRGKRLIIVIILILLVLAAVVLAVRTASAPPVVTVLAFTGGASRAQGRARGGNSRERGHAVAHPRDLHGVGIALNRYARSLGPEQVVGTHPLDRDRYEPPSAVTVTVAGGGRAKKAPAPKKPWTEYETWEELSKDEGATAKYLAQRAAVLNNPDLDWSPVLKEMVPKLRENREYIGLVNLEPDGKTLRLVAHEASPIETGSMKSETAFAAVPGELVAKHAARPAMFLFHTHPADPRGSPLPSSHDLSTCVYFAAAARFAANAIISRYGVLVYGLNYGGYKAISEAKDWRLAMLNLSHDVVAAHEAVRSWSAHSIQDYLGFYPRHRLLMFVFPTPEMVGDQQRYEFIWDLERPIDHEIIAEHGDDIVKHRRKTKSDRKGAQSTELALAPGAALDIGLD